MDRNVGSVCESLPRTRYRVSSNVAGQGYIPTRLSIHTSVVHLNITCTVLCCTPGYNILHAQYCVVHLDITCTLYSTVLCTYILHVKYTVVYLNIKCKLLCNKPRY